MPVTLIGAPWTEAQRQDLEDEAARELEAIKALGSPNSTPPMGVILEALEHNEAIRSRLMRALLIARLEGRGISTAHGYAIDLMGAFKLHDAKHKPAFASWWMGVGSPKKLGVKVRYGRDGKNEFVFNPPIILDDPKSLVTPIYRD